jgi:hypothetical protein
VEAVPERVHGAYRREPGGIAWLLDQIDDHRVAVRYDLLNHGYRLEWVGTRRLPWGDAFAILTRQRPEGSALWRETHPDEYNRTRLVETLEILAVLVQRGNLARGNPAGAKSADMPRHFSDLLSKSKTPKATEDQILAGMAEMAKLLAPE